MLYNTKHRTGIPQKEKDVQLVINRNDFDQIEISGTSDFATLHEAAMNNLEELFGPGHSIYKWDFPLEPNGALFFVEGPDCTGYISEYSTD